jgi:uncharacterized protein
MTNYRKNAVMMDARIVAEVGFRGLMRGKRVVVPGFLNKLTSTLAKFTSAQFAAKIVRKVNGK